MSHNYLYFWLLYRFGLINYRTYHYFEKVNKVPYEPRRIQELLQQNHPGSTITSSTLPKISQKNVSLAGTTHPVSGVVFDNRGLPIFDNVALFDTRISLEAAAVKKESLHMRTATRDLRVQIEAGKVAKNIFTEKQLKAINSGKEKIPDLTWHHHQDTGRMQLIPEKIHNQTGHVGGVDLWYDK
jgi:filamentous hemagglutinin